MQRSFLGEPRNVKCVEHTDQFGPVGRRRQLEGKTLKQRDPRGNARECPKRGAGRLLPRRPLARMTPQTPNAGGFMRR